METERIREFAQELRESTEIDEATVWIGRYDEEIELFGNRVGLLRFAAEVLAATYGESNPEYLFGARKPDSFPSFVKSISLQEELPGLPMPESRLVRWRNKAAGAGCLLLVLFVAVCAFFGFGLIVKAVFTR